MLDILAIGELNPDLILSGFTASGPVLGTEQVYTDETLTLGSSTAIACVLMQRLGLTTALASVVGDDDYGAFCRNALAREGVETAMVRSDPARATGVTVSVTYPGDRLLLTRLGSMAAMSGAHVDTAAFARARHLHTGSLFLLDALRPDLPALLGAARAAGCTVSVDPGWDPTGRWDSQALAAILPLTDLFLPNRDEALAMTGQTRPENALTALADLGARRVAMKAGADGGLCLGTGGLVRHPGFAAEVVDTTGAGDAFNAGFVYGLLAGWEDADCLRLANACGAGAVQAAGGTGGLRSLAEARDIVKTVGETLPDI